MLPFHPLHFSGALPEHFTNPFDYTPSEVVRAAARELIDYLTSQEAWAEELSRGKMFGVLIVKNHLGELGFLAAFSGNIAGRTCHEYFTPPIFDLYSSDSFFARDEERISAINREIDALERNAEYNTLRDNIEHQKEALRAEVVECRALAKESKHHRDEIRQTNPPQDILSQLLRDSQHQKAELKRVEARAKETMALLDAQLTEFKSRIDELKQHRQNLSQELQVRLFESYIILNSRGEQISLYDLFQLSRGVLPPAGTGECAAPKLLNYAFSNNLTIISMGEFWWGATPKGEVRHQGEYYTACKSKCEPILTYMLGGLELESASSTYSINRELRILYQDEWLAVVDKPAGMLSVRGRAKVLSVEEMIPKLFPKNPEAKVVHRLDMDTSGLLVIALDSNTFSAMQRQFATRQVIKEYVAILDGVISSESGEITLPLSSDYEQRPRQKVDLERGKEAITDYRVISTDATQTRVALSPHTGRTHQLRVHCAHNNGLGVPIVGDRLYGHPAHRLLLHAAKISFTHPITQSVVLVSSPAEF